MSITLQRDSNLLAVICDDLVVRVVDIETRRVVRELGGFRARVLDMVRNWYRNFFLDVKRIILDILARFSLAHNYLSRFHYPDV